MRICLFGNVILGVRRQGHGSQTGREKSQCNNVLSSWSHQWATGSSVLWGLLRKHVKYISEWMRRRREETFIHWLSSPIVHREVLSDCINLKVVEICKELVAAATIRIKVEANRMCKLMQIRNGYLTIFPQMSYKNLGKISR